jgi:hypothetical protein
MAKGDHKRVETEINSQRNTGMAGNTRMNDSIYGSNQQFNQNFNQAGQANFGTYNDMMGRYNELYANPFGPGGGGPGGGGWEDPYGEVNGLWSNLAHNGGGYGWDGLARGAVSDAIGGYGDFAKTGGFSNQDIQDIRARSVAPSRAVYQLGENAIQRQRALNPFSPNANAAISQMARNRAIDIGDINVNANAGIAQMRQQGKLAGLGGLSQTGLGVQGASTNIDQLNAQMKLAGINGMEGVAGARAAGAASNARANADSNEALFRARMGALGGMNELYGTTPGLLNTTGSQLLGSQQNMMGGQQMSNAFGSDMINARMGNAQVPGNFQTALGNIGGAINLGSSLVNPIQAGMNLFRGSGGGGGYGSGAYYGSASGD